MAAVIEIEFLQGNNEQVVKEVAICGDGGTLALSIPPALSNGTSRLQREWIELGRWLYSLQSSPNSTDWSLGPVQSSVLERRRQMSTSPRYSRSRNRRFGIPGVPKTHGTKVWHSLSPPVLFVSKYAMRPTKCWQGIFVASISHNVQNVYQMPT